MRILRQRTPFLPALLLRIRTHKRHLLTRRTHRHITHVVQLAHVTLLLFTTLLSLYSLFTLPNFFHMVPLPYLSLLAVLLSLPAHLPIPLLRRLAPRNTTLLLFSLVAVARGFVWIYSRAEGYCVPPSAWLDDEEMRWECGFVSTAFGVTVGVIVAEVAMRVLRWVGGVEGRGKGEVERRGLMSGFEEEDEDDDDRVDGSGDNERGRKRTRDGPVEDAEEEEAEAWGEFVEPLRRTGCDGAMV